MVSVTWQAHQRRAATPEQIACLICERVNPPCGWEQPQMVSECPGFGTWSVCQDCADRRTMGMD